VTAPPGKHRIMMDRIIKKRMIKKGIREGG
jgi:hypothetical protein